MRKYKTIIVDDHKIFGEGFGALLESNDFRVLRIFQDPKLALDYFKKNNNIDIVFCDINMPYISGIELLKSIKKINHEVKISCFNIFNKIPFKFSNIGFF